MSEESFGKNTNLRRVESGTRVTHEDAHTLELNKKKVAYLEHGLKKISQHQLEYPALSQVLELVDFAKLKGLFLERVKRTDPFYATHLSENLPFAEKQRIIPIDGDALRLGACAANAHIDKMLITVTRPSLPPPLPTSVESPQQPSKELPASLLHDQQVARNLALFHTVIHEETHIVSAEIPDDVYRTGVLTAYRAGFEFTTGGGVSDTGEAIPKKAVLMRSFNEGVTEKISQEISTEYIRRYGLGTSTILDWQKHTPENYEAEMLLVDSMIEIISADSGIPRDKVWNAINEAYFTGRADPLGAVRNLFINVAGFDFWALFPVLSGVSYTARTMSVNEALKIFVESGKLSSDLVPRINKTLSSSIPPPLPVN